MTPPPSKRVRLGPPTVDSTSAAPASTLANSNSEPKRRARTSALSGSSESDAQANDEGNKAAETFAQVTSLSHTCLVREMPLSEVYYVPSFVVPSEAEEWYHGLLGLDSWYQPKLKIFGREVTQSRKIAAYSTDPQLTLKYSGQTVDMRYTYPPLLRIIQDKVEKLLGVRFNHVMLNLYEDGGVYIGNHRDNLENKVIASLSLGAPRTFIMSRDHKVKPPSNSSHLTVTSNRDVPHSKPPPSSNGKPNVNRKRKSGQALEGNEAEGSDEARQKNQDDDETGSLVSDSRTSVELVDKKTWILDPGSLVVMQGETQRYWKHHIPKEPKVKNGRISLTFRQLVNGSSS